jgi:hydrogenase nickel incorporation protein HypA/HybF
MHEASLMSDLMSKLETVLQGQGEAEVLSVHITLGALAHISPVHFREHFSTAAYGTRLADTRLEVTLMHDINDPRAQDIILESVEVSA